MRWLKARPGEVRSALREVFARKSAVLIAAAGAIVFGGISVFIPIGVTPGNSLGFFLQITSWWALLLLLALAALMGILTAMQIHIWRATRTARINEAGTGITAAFSSFVAGVFSSATCAACVSALFSFLVPPAGIFFLLKYRWWITAAGLALVMLSIMLTSRRIARNCGSCRIG